MMTELRYFCLDCTRVVSHASTDNLGTDRFSIARFGESGSGALYFAFTFVQHIEIPLGMKCVINKLTMAHFCWSGWG